MSKTLFITGATSGIGEATALLFAQHGWRIIMSGRRKDRLASVEKKLIGMGADVLSLCFDVRDRQSVNTSLQSLPAQWSKIDVLVNNAGLSLGLTPIQEGNADDWDTMIDTNVKGLLYVSQAIIPGMVKRQEGHIINIGSIAGKDAYPNGNVYCSTKHAVEAITKSMRQELLAESIRVSNVCPGAVDTEFSTIRFKGDKQRADEVYQGFTPLYAQDIADIIYYVASLPPHVNINDILVMPTAQATATMIHRK